ncbi:membrane protein [Geobacillus genomosp. 3]|uniref:Membrane protein n=1 Tax=Geobacillus genomosp. 3 TaxID=1921421 RepID=S5ZQ99_GEOG3|nr:YqzK family protein [Geobacillus genomosp. 3]AGT32633.1 membrane protein [Geobacillus genomosp. 3]
MKTVWQMVKVFLLFTGCTILFYYSLVWFNREYEYYHRYDEPGGSAVKVSTNESAPPDWLNRLLFFYRDGE